MDLRIYKFYKCNTLYFLTVCGTITEPRAAWHRAMETQEEGRQEGRIVNGTTSISGAAPWMARLWSRSKRTHFCGVKSLEPAMDIDCWTLHQGMGAENRRTYQR